MAETLQRDEIIVREIVDTARVLFRKSGFKKTTMGDIARSLGKAKSSLYYYYPSKEDIFEAVIYAEMDELLDEIHQAISEATSSKGKLTAYCRCRLEKLSQGRLLGRYFAAKRERLREVARDLGVHHLANLGGCPAR